MAYKDVLMKRKCELAYYHSHLEKIRFQKRGYYHRNKEKMQAYGREYYAAHRDKLALGNEKSRIKRYFGISYEEYQAYFKQAKGYCAICGRNSKGTKALKLGLDHNHKTGKIRGVLCMACNAKVAWLENLSTKIKEHLDKGI